MLFVLFRAKLAKIKKEEVRWTEGTNVQLLEGWERSFTHWQDYRKSPNPFGFSDLFPIFGLTNGDLIVEIIGEKERGAIYYLDHENGSGDWKRLADSFPAFLDVIASLWFPALEWHESLELFYDHDLQRLSAVTEFAGRWKSFIASNG